jgi:V-type H+-transporting ATPase subunit F
MSTPKSRVLISVIGDEDTVTGFLLAGVGQIDSSQRPNYLVVDSKTSLAKIEETFEEFTKRTDIAIILINQHVFYITKVADLIRGVLDHYHQAFPTFLEIPSKDHPYDPTKVLYG